MEEGVLYFATEEFYQKFYGYGVIDENPAEGHGRPCCYLFKISPEEELYWMIPISSRTDKYQKIHDRSMQKYGQCDNISFGYVLGIKKAFLIQNMFPVTEKYIQGPYIDKTTQKPVSIGKQLMTELSAKARKKYNLSKVGKKLDFSEIDIIEKMLMEENQKEKK